jgi:hypothetical protein
MKHTQTIEPTHHVVFVILLIVLVVLIIIIHRIAPEPGFVIQHEAA